MTPHNTCAHYATGPSIDAHVGACSGLSFRLLIELKPRSLAAVIERLEVFSQSPDRICYSRRSVDDMASMVLFFDRASDPVRDEIKSWLNQLVGVRTLS